MESRSFHFPHLLYLFNLEQPVGFWCQKLKKHWSSTTTSKPFVPSIWGRLHEPKENYAGSGTWISFFHSFLSSNMPSLRPLTSISCHITYIHVFFGLLCALLTCPNLIRSTRRADSSVGLRRTWPNHRRRFSLIFSSIEATPNLEERKGVRLRLTLEKN